MDVAQKQTRAVAPTGSILTGLRHALAISAIVLTLDAAAPHPGLLALLWVAVLAVVIGEGRAWLHRTLPETMAGVLTHLGLVMAPVLAAWGTVHWMRPDSDLPTMLVIDGALTAGMLAGTALRGPVGFTLGVKVSTAAALMLALAAIVVHQPELRLSLLPLVTALPAGLVIGWFVRDGGSGRTPEAAAAQP